MGKEGSRDHRQDDDFCCKVLNRRGMGLTEIILVDLFAYYLFDGLFVELDSSKYNKQIKYYRLG